MKNQALFSSKDTSKKLKCLLQFLFSALRVKVYNYTLCFSGHLTKGINFCDFLFAFLDKKVFSK